MAKEIDGRKKSLTISLSAETIAKLRVLAVRRSTSVSNLIAEHIAVLTGSEKAYEDSHRAALAPLEKGFHLGGIVTNDRNA